MVMSHYVRAFAWACVCGLRTSLDCLHCCTALVGTVGGFVLPRTDGYAVVLFSGLPARTMPTIAMNGAPFSACQTKRQNEKKGKNQLEKTNQSTKEQPHPFLHLVAGISRATHARFGAWRAAPLMERWFYHEASMCQSGTRRLVRDDPTGKVRQNRSSHWEQYVRKSPKRNVKRM